MTLLGQQKRFEAFDFCYHMMRVNTLDRQDVEMQGGGVRHILYVSPCVACCWERQEYVYIVL